MDCARDLEFHIQDDNHRALAKAKESILLMKKKMFLSHDLILQYNNKVKECKRLEGDLCKAQETASKLKQENNVNRSKIIKLEMQNTEYEKNGRELEQKIADKDVQIAGDKSHLRQLECKLEAVESKHEEYAIEEEMKRSLVEDKVKELVQELKTLKKAHSTEMAELKRTLKCPQEKKGKKIIEVVKETNEIGVNTDPEARPPKPVKPSTADKSVLTNEFYHIVNNPYPLFCDRCEDSMRPKVEKICEIMSHPPLITHMLSPVRNSDSTSVAKRQQPRQNSSNNVRSGGPYFKISPPEFNGNETTNKNANLNFTKTGESNFIPVETISRNFVTPLAPQVKTNIVGREIEASPMETSVPEIDELRLKITALERVLKKQRKRKLLDSSSVNCCSHSRSMTCGSYPSSQPSQPPNVFPNAQTDVMTEFMKRIMDVVNERNRPEKVEKVDSRRKKRTLRDDRARIKLQKRGKMEISMKNRNRGINGWKVDRCEPDVDRVAKKNVDGFDSKKSHLLRIKNRPVVDSTETLFTDEEMEKFSQTEDFWEASFAETETKPRNDVADWSEKCKSRVETDSNLDDDSSVADCAKPKAKLLRGVTRAHKRKTTSMFGTDDGSDTEDDFAKNNVVPETATKYSEKSSSTAKTRSKRLRDENIERKIPIVEISASKQRTTSNSIGNPSIPESGTISSDESIGNPEICIISENVPNNDFVSDSKESFDGGPLVDKSDVDQSDVSPAIYSDSEISGSMNLQDRVKLRKRKRSNSPKPTKPTGRSKLLGRLRALKKNSNSTVAKTSNATSIRATRSLSRAKITERSKTEVSDEETKEAEKICSVGKIEPSACVTSKKQRIAHVPKKATNSQIDEELSTSPTISTPVDCPKKIRRNNDDESTMNCGIAVSMKPTTRQSAIAKLSQIRSKNDENSPKKAEIFRGAPTVGVTNIFRRRVSAKRNGNEVMMPSNDRKDSSTVEINCETAGETSAHRDAENADSNDIVGKNENSSEIIGVGNKNTKTLECPEAELISKRGETESERTAEVSIVQSGEAEKSSTPLISEANVSTDDGRVARALPTDKPKPSASLDVRPASPVASNVPHDGISTNTADISPPTSKSDVTSGATSIGDPESNGKSLRAKTSRTIDEIGAPSVFPVCLEDIPNSAECADDKDTAGLARKNDASEGLEISSNDASGNETIPMNPESPDSSPQSPISSPQSPCSSPVAIPTSPAIQTKTLRSRTTSPPERVSIYDNIELSTFHEETANSMSSNNCGKPAEKAPAFDDIFVHRDDADDGPMEKPIERNLLVYDADLNDAFDDEPEKFNSNEKSNVFAEPMKVVKELRSRQVTCGPSTSASNQNPRMPVIPSDGYNCRPDNYSGPRSLGTLLNHYLGNEKQKSGRKAALLRKAGAVKLQTTLETNVKAELSRLVEAEEWTVELHNSVIEKLRNIRSERTIAKSVVDFLIERASFDEPLDRTHTPPAPIMTGTQQRIVTLINCLQQGQTASRLFDLVQLGIEYTIWQSTTRHEANILEYLIRMFTIISRIRKDRERVRILCYDALYCLGRLALSIIYVILTTWPEVLPMHGTVNSELPNCLAHLIHLQPVGSNPFPKIVALKKLITTYYGYSADQVPSNVVTKALIKAFSERYSIDLEAAILLISKREGCEWALKNVVENGLMEIIRGEGCEWPYETLSLLGFVLRPFPTVDTDETVKKFVQLLREMLISDEGSQDKQEGVVSALLSLARFKSQHPIVSDALLKWKPRKELRSLTLEQLNSFFKSRPPMWWNSRLQWKIKNDRKTKQRK